MAISALRSPELLVKLKAFFLSRAVDAVLVVPNKRVVKGDAIAANEEKNAF